MDVFCHKMNNLHWNQKHVILLVLTLVHLLVRDHLHLHHLLIERNGFHHLHHNEVEWQWQKEVKELNFKIESRKNLKIVWPF